MLSSFFSYLGPTAKIRRKDIENPESLIPRIKCQLMHPLITLWVMLSFVTSPVMITHLIMYSDVYVVPHWLENCCRKFDDYPIQWIQQRLSNMSFVLLRLLKGTVLFKSSTYIFTRYIEIQHCIKSCACCMKDIVPLSCNVLPILAMLCVCRIMLS